jgi:hypothetical protein
MIMGICHCSALELSMMQDQKLFALHMHSFLRRGSNMVVVPFAYKGRQYCHDGLILLCSTLIIREACPEIDDAP